MNKSKGDFSALSTPKLERVDIEGCDPIFVRELLLGADEQMASAGSKTAAIVSMSCVDAEGSQIWSYDEAKKLSKAAAAPLLSAFYKANGIDMETLQEAEKN